MIVEGFEDPESGIDMINVRIAGINTDYVSNTIVERGLYKIKLPQDLKDGYEYKAIIQVGMNSFHLFVKATHVVFKLILVIIYYMHLYM